MSTLIIPTGLGELKITADPEGILVCYGLGSCIGLTLYDPAIHLGIMAHVVLPDSNLGRGGELAPAKFANTAVPEALAWAAKYGAKRSRLIARIAGGARMLNLAGIGSKLDIGSRNVESVRVALRDCGIPLATEDTGGTYGRTLQLFVGTGRVLVSTVGRGEREL
jgi:chemotaxis protein CheD